MFLPHDPCVEPPKSFVWQKPRDNPLFFLMIAMELRIYRTHSRIYREDMRNVLHNARRLRLAGNLRRLP